jgi:ribosomal protein S17
MNPSRYLIVCLSLLKIMTTAVFAQYPQTVISNGMMNARIYLPDAEKGYYRATRFDWSGLNAEIVFGAHRYAGQWFDKYDPLLHDAVMGPVEAFSPIGFEQAPVNGHFITIGVGVLERPDSTSYSPYRYYKIINPGKWKTEIKTNQVSFSQKIQDNSCSYQYEKTESLLTEKPVMLLTHKLRNTGKREIETTVYDHNFFLIDSTRTGPAFEIIFTFPLKEKKEGRGLGDLAGTLDNRIIIRRQFLKGDQAYTLLEGFDKKAKGYDIRIENHKTGAAIHITANRPLSKLVFWACATVLCPEPYIQMKLKPGETATWKISYEFYECRVNP